MWNQETRWKRWRPFVFHSAFLIFHFIKLSRFGAGRLGLMIYSLKPWPLNDRAIRRFPNGRLRRSTAAVQTLRAIRQCPARAKRLDCGDFSTAVVRSRSHRLKSRPQKTFKKTNPAPRNMAQNVLFPVQCLLTIQSKIICRQRWNPKYPQAGAIPIPALTRHGIWPRPSRTS